MGIRKRTAGNLADPVTEHFQRALRCDCRIQLSQTAGCRIAWIYKRLLPLRLSLPIQLLETSMRYIDLTAHFQYFRNTFADQSQRN